MTILMAMAQEAAAASNGIGAVVGTGAGITSLVVILARIYWEIRREKRAVETVEKMNPPPSNAQSRRRNAVSSTDVMVERMAYFNSRLGRFETDFDIRLGRFETKLEEYHKDGLEAHNRLRRDFNETAKQVAVLWDRSERELKTEGE